MALPNIAAVAATPEAVLVHKGSKIDYLGLGLNFDRDDWLLMMELSHAQLGSAVRIDGAYGLLGRRLGKFTPYAMFS